MLATRIAPDELRELARRQGCRQLELPLTLLPRMRGLLALEGQRPEEPTLRATVAFREGRNDFPEASFVLAATLPLRCQRCLQVIDHRIELEFELTIVAKHEDFVGLQEQFDVVAMDPEGLCLLTVIEDEILADLPIAPMHAQHADCEGSPALMDESGGASDMTNRPFADLAALVGRVQTGRAE